MSENHTIQPSDAQIEGIIIPLNLEEFTIHHQAWQADGSLLVVVRARSLSETCPHCQCVCVKRHDERARRKRDLPCRDIRLFIVVLKRRFRCETCHRVFTEVDQSCGWRRRTTQRLREQIATHARRQPRSDVARHFSVGSRFVLTCWKQHLHTQLQEQGLPTDEEQLLPTPRFLGLDEFARRKGQVYDTMVCDLEQRRVLEVGAGRRIDDVGAVLTRLSDPLRVEAVSMDMSASFRPAVKAFLPHATIVVDHFHVIQHVMKAFGKVVSSWAKKKEATIVLHRKRHLFLMVKEHLTAEQEQQRQQIAARLPLLEQAWKLKEGLRDWYATATVETAEALLDDWLTQVRASSCEPMKQAISIFERWREEIVAFFRFRISNGFVEGKNNRTKMMMRRGYGFTNRAHLRLMILAGNFS